MEPGSNNADELLVKMSPRTPADLCASYRIEIEDEARPLLAEGTTPNGFLRALIAGGHLMSAVRYLAHGLPKREAVWWACQSIRAAGLRATPQDAAALRAAEAWVYEPTEERRRAAEAAADEAGLESPAGLAAMGVFFSGGSIAPAEFEAVPPAEHLTGAMVASAVLCAAFDGPPDSRDTSLRRALAKGIEIAMGRSTQETGG